ncbi:MAG: hypothetical protein L0221_03155 [Chloroflexi bacterium]|nr:hypothetical protein [Chloroflexota bacterium]
MVGPTWLDDVRRLLEHVAASDATELEYRREGFRVRLTRRPGHGAPTPVAVAEDQPIVGDLVQVIAPLTGVFYRASSPGASPLISVGEEVQPDTVVCLIETMKVFNEVTAECRGLVRQILVESGQLTQAGDCLMLVDSTADDEAEQVRS